MTRKVEIKSGWKVSVRIKKAQSTVIFLIIYINLNFRFTTIVSSFYVDILFSL